MKSCNPQHRRQGAGTTAWRIVAALLALCLVVASCTSADDASVDGAGTADSDAITQSTAAASDGRAQPATTESSNDMADEEQTGALGGAAAEEAIEAAFADEADEEMSDDGGLSEESISSRSSGGAHEQTEAAVSEHSGEPEIEPYEPTQRRRTEPDKFVDYGVNPFVDTDDDPFSTFALDVDTASYTIARNFLDGGQLPPFEAVRVEEFVNYFNGGYDDEIDEFTITVDAAPSPFADSGDLLLRVGVQAPHVVSDAVRPDSIIVVLDSSGSMNQEIGTGNDRTRRIELVYDAVDLLLEGLEPETRVGVVAYADWARTVSRPAAVGRNHDDLIRRIERDVRPSGSTNVADGLVAGYRMAESEADSGRDVLVLLFSDGVANVGATETDRILRQLGERADIGLSTIGVGLGPFNDELMEQLANRADGSYHYIDDHDEAWRLLGDDVTSFVSVAARDAKVQVIFNPDTVAAYRLLGFENRDVADRDFRNDAVDAGEVAISQSATALYELTLVDPDSRSRRSSETLAKVTLRYQRPASENITEVSETIRGSDAHRSFDNADRHFRLAAVAAEFAEVLRQSWFVDDPLMRTLRHEAEGLARDFRGDADVAELARLIAAAQRLG
ncbi:YfbK domain-containing protein [Candidatus Poriferisodalis sp.]|uniref:vWA domain-containing protein n=1 Tax=Candidatus Poriferisodalis sp. TaxID=3101277 RepID=UPI003B029E06